MRAAAAGAAQTSSDRSTARDAGTGRRVVSTAIKRATERQRAANRRLGV